MRRLALVLVGCVLLLPACRRGGEFPPEEVLRRSALAGSQLQSAEYKATVDLSLEIMGSHVQATAKLSGVIAHGGEQTSMKGDVHGSYDQGVQHMNLSTLFDLVRDREATYFQIHSLTAEPPMPMVANLQSIVGHWWQAPASSDGSAESTLTPDPAFLKSQADAVRVLSDKGLETVDGHDAYHYGVTLDPDKLLAVMKASAEEAGRPFDAETARTDLAKYDADGELWIDATTFFVDRLEWTITAKENPKSLRATLHVELSKHNAAVPVEPPADAKPFDASIIKTQGLPEGVLNQDATLSL